MSHSTDRARTPAPLTKKLGELYELIEGIEIAMFTTRRPDGHLVSRPMATQTQAEGSDLWFVTNIESHKLDELEFDPHVNLANYRDRTREWVSVSGTATVSQDRRAIHELYRKDWKAWFGDEGGGRDGGPDDPRLALILVDVESVIYLKVDKPQPLVLFEVAKGMVTGTPQGRGRASGEQRGDRPGSVIMPQYPVTPDGRYLVVGGRLWRRSNPTLPESDRVALVRRLMHARREVRAARQRDDPARERLARRRVHQAKVGLGERGPVWWQDGAPDYNRRRAFDTPYRDWFLSSAGESMKHGMESIPADVAREVMGGNL